MIMTTERGHALLSSSICIHSSYVSSSVLEPALLGPQQQHVAQAGHVLLLFSSHWVTLKRQSYYLRLHCLLRNSSFQQRLFFGSRLFHALPKCLNCHNCPNHSNRLMCSNCHNRPRPVQALLPEFCAIDLSNLLWACATLRHTDNTLFHAAVPYVLACCRGFVPQVRHALAVYQHEPHHINLMAG